MIILGFIAITAIVLFILAMERNSEECGVASFFAAIIFCVLIITMPVKYYQLKSHLEEFKAVAQTVTEQRETLTNIPLQPLERVRLTEEIIKHNKWLAKVKFWNGTLFDIWIPDEVMNIKPIK